jgi:hypothetical protein
VGLRKNAQPFSSKLKPMKMRIATIVLGLMPLLGSARECTRDEAYAAESVVDYLTSWENVHLFYQQFRHCYDGGIAEGVQDRVQLLWSDRWSDLPKMLSLTKKEPKFNAFVMRSLFTEAFPQETFDKVLRNATTRCPAIGRAFCAEVKKAAKVGNGF